MRNAAIAGLAVLLVFLLLFLISAPFEYGAQSARPVLTVVGLMIVAGTLAFVGLGYACQVSAFYYKKLLMVIFGLALSIRLVALFTTPILEIDYYRYVWDGKVVCEGVSPYRFSPAQVLEPGVAPGKDLERVSQLATQSESNYAALNRIHYEKYTTLYPPVSQFVFAVAMKLTPESFGIEAHVIVMKIAMLLFDLGTILLLAGLLKMARIHPGWLIAYAWNPLVIKEIANSGHLDAIATFFVVLTLYFVAKQKLLPHVKLQHWLLLLAGVTLGLAVGAKLYPLVIFPALLVAVSANNGGTGKRLLGGAVFSVAFVLTSCLVLIPMFQKHGDGEVSGVSQTAGQTVEGTLSAAKSDPEKTRDGFGGFFSSWRMNDPIFSTVYFNLKSDANESMQPWFVVTNKPWRARLDQWFRSFGADSNDPAHLMARALTLSLFSCFYLFQLVKLYNSKDGEAQWVIHLVRRITLILAMFLILQPTVNPWYLVWVAPLTCMTNNRGWLLASGFLMLYYTRFWFKSLAGTFVFGGQSFDGVSLFDHCFVFVEFGLILAVLIFFQTRNRDETSDLQNAA